MESVYEQTQVNEYRDCEYKIILKAYPHNIIVVYDSSLRCMRLCHNNRIPDCYSLANVAIGPEDSYD